MLNIMTTLVASHYSTDDYLFFLLNLGIIAGYLGIVITVLFAGRLIPAISILFSKRSRASMAVFFIVASITRIEFAYEAVTPSYDPQFTVSPYAIYSRLCREPIPNHQLVLHVLQVIFIWAMMFCVAHDLLTRFTIKDEE